MTKSQQLATIIDEWMQYHNIWNFMEDEMFAASIAIYWCVEQLQYNGLLTQQEALELLGIQGGDMDDSADR